MQKVKDEEFVGNWKDFAAGHASPSWGESLNWFWIPTDSSQPDPPILLLGPSSYNVANWSWGKTWGYLWPLFLDKTETRLPATILHHLPKKLRPIQLEKRVRPVWKKCCPGKNWQAITSFLFYKQIITDTPDFTFSDQKCFLLSQLDRIVLPWDVIVMENKLDQTEGGSKLVLLHIQIIQIISKLVLLYIQIIQIISKLYPN